MSRFLKLPEIIHNNASCHAGIYAAINKGLYPKPVKVGRMSVWPESEDAAVRLARIAGKTDAELQQIVLDLEAARKDAYRNTVQQAQTATA